MIYERGSSQSRATKMPSAWKSNKRPLRVSEWGGSMYRKPFTGWSCIKQTPPPQIFMARDLLINLSLSSISLFCIHQELGAVIDHNHLHYTVSCRSRSRWATDNESTQCLSLTFHRHFLCLWWKSDFKILVMQVSETVSSLDLQLKGLTGRWVWTTTHHRGLDVRLVEKDKLPLVNSSADDKQMWTNRQRWKMNSDPLSKSASTTG